jgi:hypothetical protein
MAVNPVSAKPTPHHHLSTAKLAADAKAALGTVDFTVANPKMPRLDSAGDNPTRMKQVAKLPKPVQEAFNFYFNNVEEKDWGSVGVYKAHVDGHVVYAVHTSTDGDDGYTELFNFAGKRLATGLSGWQSDGKGGFTPTTTWDGKLGSVRSKITNP